MAKAVVAKCNSHADAFAAFCGIIWFALIIDACFTWFLDDIVRNILGTFFILFGTAILVSDNGIKLRNNRRGKLLSVIFLFFFILFTRFNVYVLFVYAPLICVLLWRDSALVKMYDYFSNFIVFYAILSIVVELMVFLGVWRSLPLIAIYPPQDYIQEALGYVNYFYGIFCIPAENTSLTFYRACGPLREGGHFIFYIGFVYLTKRIITGKINVWLLICGILTLSPNFLVMIILAEAYFAIKEKKFLKPLVGAVGIILGVFVLFLISPQVIKDEIVRIVFERLLEQSIENADSDGFMAFLDGRVGDNGIFVYEKFMKSGLLELLIGSSSFDGYELMSDYRWMLIYCGYLGTFLVLWCTYKFSYVNSPNLFGFCILALAITAFIQRAWMFIQVYIWIMMILCATKYYYVRIIKE